MISNDRKARKLLKKIIKYGWDEVTKNPSD